MIVALVTGETGEVYCTDMAGAVVPRLTLEALAIILQASGHARKGTRAGPGPIRAISCRGASIAVCCRFRADVGVSQSLVRPGPWRPVSRFRRAVP